MDSRHKQTGIRPAERIKRLMTPQCLTCRGYVLSESKALRSPHARKGTMTRFGPSNWLKSTSEGQTPELVMRSQHSDDNKRDEVQSVLICSKPRSRYRRNDPAEGWTCWGRNLQGDSNSDTPRRPLHRQTHRRTDRANDLGSDVDSCVKRNHHS